MKKRFRRLVVVLTMLALMTACQSGDLAEQNVPPPTEQLTPVLPETTPDPTMAPLSQQPAVASPTLFDSKGPLLLIQSDLQSYQFLDIGAGRTYPFEPPGPEQRYPLAANLSPSGQQMLFPISNTETVVMSLATGEITKIYQLPLNSSRFQPDLAAEQALAALPGIKYSYEAMLSAVKAAWIKSMQKIKWNQTDRFLVIVQEGSETSTHLALEDLETGTIIQLEQIPGLVEEYWVGPNGESILLKKGFVFEPSVWQDDRYFLVDRIHLSVNPVSLPDDSDNPIVSWFSSSIIGITHQMQPLGGINYSLVDVRSMASEQIVSGPFTHILPFGDHLLIVSHTQESNTTTLTLQMFDGQVLQQDQLDSLCFLSAVVTPSRLLLNCETQSLLLDESLQTTVFGETIRIFSRAPDGKAIVYVDSVGETTLLDESLSEIQELTVMGFPLEILWLPDSSGFLYRTAGQLYHYDLSTSTNQLLLTSDLFADYQNLNAVWINIK